MPRHGEPAGGADEDQRPHRRAHRLPQRQSMQCQKAKLQIRSHSDIEERCRGAAGDVPPENWSTHNESPLGQEAPRRTRCARADSRKSRLSAS